MDIQFCANDETHGVAVGAGYWQGRKGTENPARRRPSNLCRACLLALIDPDLVRVEVTTPIDAAIHCMRTGNDVEAGGHAWLDPVQTHIAQLVYAGMVKLAPEPAAAAKPAKADAKA